MKTKMKTNNHIPAGAEERLALRAFEPLALGLLSSPVGHFHKTKRRTQK